MQQSKKVSWIGALAGFGLVTLVFMPVVARTQYTTSLEERVRLLEQQTSLLTQRVANLERNSGAVGSDGIRRPFTGIGETWRITQILGAGGTLELANRTRWAVSGPDIDLVKGWRIGEIIEIQTNNNRTWPYMLVNTQKRQQVAAQYTGTR